MPVKRRVAKNRISDLTDTALAFFLDEPLPADAEKGFEIFCLRNDSGLVQCRGSTLWALHQESILELFIEQHPGERPVYWWEHEAPEAKPESESEAAFLKRHDLLLPGEVEKLNS